MRLVCCCLLAFFQFLSGIFPCEARDAKIGNAAAESVVVLVPPKSKIRAVLVGAASYSDGRLKALSGARNDAALMATTLTKLGASPTDIRLLVDYPERSDVPVEVKPVGMPTRREIIGALTRTSEEVQPDDQVVILLSGHGEQQKEAAPGSEPDGRDEVFLPIDSRIPTNYVMHETPIENSITDDEIGRAIDEIIGRGANVFFIADFCHSGDSTRGLSDGATSKDGRLESSVRNSARGSMVAFFTSRSDELGAQRATPFWAVGDGNMVVRAHGVLSYYTMLALNEPGIGSYDELFERVNGYIQASNFALGGAPASLPAPEGDTHLPVLGRRTTSAAAKEWAVRKPASDAPVAKIDKLVLPAGSMAGIRPGTIFSVSRFNANEQILLYGVAQNVRAWDTEIFPVSYANIPMERWSDVRIPDSMSTDGQMISFTQPDALLIKLVETPVTDTFKVFLPRITKNSSDIEKQLIEKISAIDFTVAGAKFVSDAAEADLVFRFVESGLQVFSGKKKGSIPYGRLEYVESSLILESIAGIIERAARFNRIQAVLAGHSMDLDTNKSPLDNISISFFLRKSEQRLSALPCSALAFKPGEDIPEDANLLGADDVGFQYSPSLQLCDEIYVKVRNVGDRPVHVTPIILAPEGAIYFLPTQPGSRVLYEPGRTGTGGYKLTTQAIDNPARDDIFFIVSEVDAARQVPVFRRSFEQGPIVCADGQGNACRRNRSRSFLGAGRGLGALGKTFAELVEVTRSAMPRVGMKHFVWYTLPSEK